MSSPSLQAIGLRGSLLKAIERKARREGRTAREYVRLLIERDLLAEKTFDEILKPVRDDFRKSGVTEDQLDGIVKRARRAAAGNARRTRK
jgi:hypothetical protein